ncbi:hypothetical protein Tco_0441443 [Tanacetum coccineum]
MACCLLHNFIRQEMPVDPFETQDESDQGTGDLGEAEDNIHSIGTSNEWTDFRNNLAQSIVSSLAEVVSEAAKLLGDRIKDSSAEMSEGIKLDVELKNKTNLITYALQKIESLTKVERFRAIRKIKSEPDSVLTFWDLKEDEREEWVRFMLSK